MQEINGLKNRITTLSASNQVTVQPPEDPQSNDIISLKLKIRELSSSLKFVTAQRDEALSKLKQNGHNTPLLSRRASYALKDNAENDPDLIQEEAELNEKYNDALFKIDLLNQTNSDLTSQIIDLKEQLKSGEVRKKSLIDAASPRKKSTSDGDVHLEQIRQEAREKRAALEYRFYNI
jgi:hypothetical protein